jgi:hypothetical protein
VTDQLRVKYSCQLLSHKWWMKLLCFILDQSTVNIYVIYLEGMEELGLKPLSYHQFLLRLGRYLIQPAIDLRVAQQRQYPQRWHRGLGHGIPQHSRSRVHCIRCRKRCQYYCVPCGNVWMHLTPCYDLVHAELGLQ